MKQLFVSWAVLAIGVAGCGDSGDGTTHVEGDTATTQPASSDGVDQPITPKAAEESPATKERSLIDAASSGDVEAVQKYIESGASLNQQNAEGGATALIAAATMGQVETASLLIEAGADLEIVDHQGGTALHAAAFLCREEIVKALLEAGANREATNKAGSTALESVAGPFDQVKPIYDLLLAILGPHGLELDYEIIEATRPKIAEMLRAE